MENSNHNIQKHLRDFIEGYTKMEVGGISINCPYWMNRLKDGKVILRGFTNGKGTAIEIREELKKRLSNLPPQFRFEVNPENLHKFAKRERIGIDCSGFAYRLLDELVKLKYQDNDLISLNKIFSFGIDKTNADILTSNQYCMPVLDIQDIKIGDLIRINGGKHIAVIIDTGNNKFTYIHSHGSTAIAGVHEGFISIIDSTKQLQYQKWQESMRTGENFGTKRYDPQKGDGVFRLKIFQ